VNDDRDRRRAPLRGDGGPEGRPSLPPDSGAAPAPKPGDGAAAPIWRHPEYARGMREMMSTAVGIAAWGLITGVAMGKSGLPAWLMVFMSLVVFAGSAQLAVLPLLSSGAPVWVVWATALCVNLRFVIFSAIWRRYFVVYPLAQRLRLAYFTADLNYVLFMRRFPEPKPAPEQLPYFWGGVSLNWLAWQVPSLLGIWLADAVPVHWGFGFAGTLALLGLTLSLLTDRATGVAGAVAACAAVAAYALPFKLNIVVAIAAAVAMGLLIDHTSARTAQPVDDRT
jgi:predicted branched-subunit amino acid permease